MSEKEFSIKLFKNDLIYNILKKYNLILLVGNKETNSLLLQKLKENLSSTILINLGYKLSQKLLDEQLEITRDPQIFFDEILKGVNEEVILLDNTDILFDHNLSFDPLYIFKKISSKKKIMAMWNGKYEQVSNKLTYAERKHLDWKEYIINNNEVNIINSEENLL